MPTTTQAPVANDADWQNGPEGSLDSFFAGAATETAANDSTYFTGGGSKDENDIPSWAITTNSVPDKDELLDAYAAVYEKDGDTWVYFGADRFDNDGDAQIGFWFFQGDVGIANGDFTGTHVDGDVLILSEYTNGGVVDLVCAYEWDGAGGGDNIANPRRLRSRDQRQQPEPRRGRRRVRRRRWHVRHLRRDQ